MMTDDAQHLQDQVWEQPYSSFLIRCWGLSDGKQRIKVQHIQSGAWTRVASFAEATAWLEGRVTGDLPARREEVETREGTDPYGSMDSKRFETGWSESHPVRKERDGG